MQGDVVGLIEAGGQYLVAAYEYDAWGKILSITDGGGGDVSMYPGHIANVNPIRYRGYYYDGESGFYYLNSRYYDPETGRFVNIDSVMGCNSDMATYNLYAYCGNNPVVRADNGGALWQELCDWVDGLLHKGNELAIAIGIDTAAVGGFFLNMEKDSNGIYHAKNDFWQWQRFGGYNDLYDRAFDIGTSMASAKFEFSYAGEEYVIWAWKGDYINLGAGAELGIYYGGGPHWLVDTSLGMYTYISVYYKGQNIIRDVESSRKKRWWATAFNPNVRNVEAGDLRVVFRASFDDRGMFEAFRNRWSGRDHRLRFSNISSTVWIYF